MQTAPNLTATTTPKKASEVNQATNAAALGSEVSPEQQKLFADLLSKQLMQQKKALKAAEAEEGNARASLSVPLATNASFESTHALGADVSKGQARAALRAAESTEAQAPMQDMLLMQMQTPLASHTQVVATQVDAASTSIENAELLTNPTATSPATAILNAQNTSKSNVTANSGHATGAIGGKVANHAVTGRETVEVDAERLSAGMSALDKKAESVAQATQSSVQPSSQASFSEVLSEQATSTQAMTPNLAASTMGKLESNPALSAITSSEITTAFGKTDWNHAVNQKVVWMMGAGEQSATLTLNPPDLGPLQVVIQVDNQHVDTTFISDNPEVRQALEDGMSMLRDKMSESGMSLGQAQVNSGEQSQREARQHAQEASRQRANPSNTVQDDIGTPSTPTVRYVRNGLVDTFA